MSIYDYEVSKQISAGRGTEPDPPFAALIMAAIRKADSDNNALIQATWPEIYEEFKQRYNAAGGLLPSEGTVHG